jgi:hypothetical protein
MTPTGVVITGSFDTVDNRPRSLSDEEAKVVVAALRRLLAQFKTQADLERRHPEIRQQTISKYLSGTGRPGWAFAKVVASALGYGSLEDMVGRTAGHHPMLSTYAEWPDILEAAIRLEPALEPKMRHLGRVAFPDRIALTPQWLVAMAVTYFQGVVRDNPAK